MFKNKSKEERRIFLKRDLIREVFEGSYSPAENVLPDAPEYKDMKDRIHDDWAYFEKKMTGRDQERLEQLQDLIAGLQYMENFAFFKEGIRIGKLLLEI